MKVIKRLSATLNASIDSFVNRIEDHEAVVEKSLREIRQAAARTRVQLSRVNRDAEALQRRLDEARQDMTRWTERAKANVADEETALACLKRRKSCESRIGQLEQATINQTQARDRIQANLEQLEQRIESLSRKRNSMRSRASIAEAMRVVNQLDGHDTRNIDEVFERWEVNLAEAEIELDPLVEPGDEFEADFVRAEERSALLAELAQLKNVQGGRDND